MKPLKKLFALALLAALAVTSLRAGNWAHWRGPNFNGSSPEKNLPDDFSKTNNVKWVALLPGPSAATPIIWGDTVFISSTDTKTKTLRAMAFDRKTGKELWNNEVTQGFSQDGNSNFASPSPTTDGKLVYFLYGTGDLAAFDFKGKKVWSRDLGKDYGQFAYQWTYGASPTLFDGKLYVQVLQRDVPVHGRGRKDGPGDSYLLALEPKTGKELWRHVRPSDAAEESKEAYSTPIPFMHGGVTEMLISGGDCLSAHDPKTGAELWRWGSWNPTRITHWRLVPSPVASESGALVCAPKGSPVFSVKHGGKGALDDSWVAWQSPEREISSDVCTPLLYEGRYYILNGDKKVLARVDPATGKPDWIGDLGSRIKIECSPTGADGKIYFQNFRGEVFIVAADKEFKLLRTIPMGDEGDDRLRSVVAVSQGNLFLRTGSKLYCIGGTAAASAR
jgi:outer membrane protein assembly factor BamB